MPYKSVAQERYFNANRSKIGAAVVDEFNAASKGKKLPTVSSEEKRRKAVSRGAPPEGKLKGESHTYDHNRAKRPIRSRYSR